jgi:hypothetical protein
MSLARADEVIEYKRPFAAVHESVAGTNATLGNVRFFAGYEGEADITHGHSVQRAYGRRRRDRKEEEDWGNKRRRFR